MHQAHIETNADPSGNRRNRRPAITLAAGLIALAIATAVVLEQPDGRPSASTDAAMSSLASPATARLDGNAASGRTSAVDAATPRFERSDEPAIEDSTNAHGG